GLGGRRERVKGGAAGMAGRVEGAEVERVRRVGKHIVFDLTRNGRGTPSQWIVHLGMTGRMLVAAADTELAKHTHLVARMASGRELRFVDPRRFGRLEVRDSTFSGPGAEPLEISQEDFGRRFQR